jgi:hypothetical protein
MTLEMKQWVKASKMWVKTQKASIESCDLNTRHHREQISLLQKSIRLEKLERIEKVKQLRLTEMAIKKAK